MTQHAAELFGDKQHFAIEAMIEPELVAPSMAWGRMRIWCEGVALGNIEDEYCGLDHAFSQLDLLARDVQSLWRDEFSRMREGELLDFLEECLFCMRGDIDLPEVRNSEEIRLDWERYGRFSFLTNWGEQFDRCGHPFILCPPDGRIVIMSRAFAAERAYTLSSDRAAFCNVVRDAIVWFDEQKAALGA